VRNLGEKKTGKKTEELQQDLIKEAPTPERSKKMRIFNHPEKKEERERGGGGIRLGVGQAWDLYKEISPGTRNLTGETQSFQGTTTFNNLYHTSFETG